jgi:hypothetical protein
MTAHTPGPWTAEHDSEGWIIDGPHPTGRWAICKSISNESRDVANMALIAAAPDMLKALKALVSASDGHPGSVQQRRAARAAIAKAENPP